jgi:hypothetical protein
MSETSQSLTANERASISWRISSWSGSGSGGSCVEVGALPDGRVVVRHSHHPDGATIVYTPAEWDAFLAGARAGEFDF